MSFKSTFVLEDSLICFADRGEGEQDWYVREDFRFMNFTTVCYLIFIFFWKTFLNLDIYPHPRPLPTTHVIQLHPRTASPKVSAVISYFGRQQLDSAQCSRTSCKRPPKVRRFSGRLRKVVSYENRTTRGVFREKVPTSSFGQRIYCIQFLFCELSIRLVPCCHCKFLVCSEWRSTYGSEQRNHTIRQVVASNPVTTTSIGKSL